MIRRLAYALVSALSALFPPMVSAGEKRLEKYILADAERPERNTNRLRIFQLDGRRHPNYRDRKVS